MRHLPLFFRPLLAVAAALMMLFAVPACAAPAESPTPAHGSIWSETVNERTGHMRQVVADFPWTEQTQQLRELAATENDGAEAESEAPQQREPAPGPEPIFVTNPAGPVNCAEVRCVALTFDDGPAPNTHRVLAALADVNARATFFMTGQMAATDPGSVAQVAAAGHELGNHGYSHTDFTELSSNELRSELSRTAAAIESATGQQPSMARPPYGSVNTQVNQEAGLPMIMWSLDSRDWQHRSAADTHQRVLDEVEPGAIVLMHDLEGSTADAVPPIVRDLLAKGYHLVTVSELLGHSAEPGQVYHNGLRP